MNLGYCCISLHCREKKPSIYTGRTVCKKLFTVEKALSLALLNVSDLYSILQWNELNNIKVFRITSELFPRITENRYSIDNPEIIYYLKRCGDFIKKHGHIISMHPGPYTVLSSDSPQVVENSLYDIEHHTWILDTMGIDANINIHVGKNHSKDAFITFVKSYRRLSKNAQKRLIIENDDNSNGWNVKRLLQLNQYTGLPITFDIHHALCFGSKDLEADFIDTIPTWNRIQEVHYSESADKNKIIPAHSEYYSYPMPDWINKYTNIYVHLECKGKDKALFHYRDNFRK